MPNVAVYKLVVDLGHILRQFPNLEFGMSDFEHRLRIQKFVYLLQAFDVYLGYDYTWYLHGPYCTKLATVGYALTSIYDIVPYDKEMVFVNPAVHERFKEFKKFIKGRENDNDFLEIAASLHILHKTSGMQRADVVKKVAAKRNRFGEDRCNQVWEEMAKYGLNGMTAGVEATTIAFRDLDGSYPDMKDRPRDRGFWHLLTDAKESKGEIAPIGKNVFRAGQSRPCIEKVFIFSEGLAVGLERQRRG